MKKEYIKPQIEIVAFETNCTLMASSHLGVTDKPSEPDAQKRRDDSWGNLWNKD